MIIKQVLHKNASHVKFLIRLIINRLMQKMSRKTLTRLLLVWLLLVASLQYFSFHIKVQATESAHFKLEAAQPSSRSRKANIWPSRVRSSIFQNVNAFHLNTMFDTNICIYSMT
ncbi:uncharacterized protein LOC126655685 isoform X1 [Mercurialis annua]|uniref:uncharacterized protein LOC126655685 isoform X1 n=1 Tax=Mercurialis annua TaxID=3986 RepID=UPI0021610510|nr:uncharacterized protein LOC126655685 isoform X1 [Mercurialis annua]